MKGIHCALAGRLGADVDRSASGKDWCRLSVGVGEGDDLTWVSVAAFEDKARALAGIARGAELYVEGRLTMNTWQGRDGLQRAGLSVSAYGYASRMCVPFRGLGLNAERPCAGKRAVPIP